jgi:hypothetical protein
MALNKNVAKGIKTRQENELRENNKLIAEFMGLVKSSYRNMYWTEKAKEGFGEGELANLLYHTSWDWLMPVVEKISQMEDDNFDMQIYARYEYVTKLPITVSREVIYKAVVEFIKWYSENKED